MAEEDVIQFGEELARFGEVRAGELDAETRQDYQTALDAYESAQRMVDKLTSAERTNWPAVTGPLDATTVVVGLPM